MTVKKELWIHVMLTVEFVFLLQRQHPAPPYRRPQRYLQLCLQGTLLYLQHEVLRRPRLRNQVIFQIANRQQTRRLHQRPFLRTHRRQSHRSHRLWCPLECRRPDQACRRRNILPRVQRPHFRQRYPRLRAMLR